MVRKRSKSPAASSSNSGSGAAGSHQRTVLIKYDESFSSWYDYGKDLPGRNDTLTSISAAAEAAVIKSEEDEEDSTNVNKNNKNDKKSNKRRPPPPPRKNDPDTVRKFRAMAEEVYQNEVRLFSNQTRGGTNGEGGSSSSTTTSAADERWMENAMKKGTLKDRIAAMSVTVASSPVHKLYALDGLLNMVGCTSTSSTTSYSNHQNNNTNKPNSRVAQLAAEAIEDLFLNTLLPPDRKLVSIGQRPLYLYDNNYRNNDDSNYNNNNNNKKKNNKNTKHTMSPRILLLWRYEELIKEKYDSFVRQYIARTLEDSSGGGTEQQKIAVLNTAATLLSSVPENESLLLTLIVNKLGDPDRKVASAAGHRLRLVLQQHSSMQTVVAREVQQLAFRPHLSSKALYNCITFLNQLQLRNTTVEDQALAASLVKTYFRLFEVAVESNNNQKKPHQNEKKKGKKKSSSKSVGVNNQDHYSGSGSMKGRLLSALLMGVNRAHPYLPEKDQDMKDHVDALYRIVHTAPPSAATQALLLLFHLAVGSVLEKEGEGRNDENMENVDDDVVVDHTKTKDSKDHQRDRYYRALYATLSKPSMVTTGKHLTMYFNALYKAMKYDSNQNRVHAFAKSLLASVIHGPSPTTAAALYMIQEISKTHPSLQSSWRDIPIPEMNAWAALDDTKREPKAALVDKHVENDEGQAEEEPGSAGETRKLIPPMWEVSALGLHFHPSVAKFANDLGQIEFDGDPLHDFGLSQFLDKFAYRNPKSREKLLKQQPKSAGALMMHSRQTSRLQSRLAMPLNDRSFLEETNVNEQDEFFHRFFVEQARRDEMKDVAKRVSSNDSDSDDENDEDDDNWKDEEQDEDDAFNAAEDAEDIDSRFKTFEEYEAEWETDEEEEDFVDSLAMSLMESEVGVPADIDDDPEGMEHWSDDMIGDGPDIGDDEDEAKDAGTEKKTKSEAGAKASYDDDSASSDDSESSDEEPNIDESEIVGELVDGYNHHLPEDDDESRDSDSDDLDMALLGDSDESGDDDNDGDIGHDDTNHFADAEEYEEMIAKSFAEFKKKRQSVADDDDEEQQDEDQDVEETPAKSHPPKRRSKKKRRRS